jgi:predicted permease
MQLSLSKRIIGAVILSVSIASVAAIIFSFLLLRGFGEPGRQAVGQLSAAFNSETRMYAMVAVAAAGIVALMAVAALFIARSIAAPIQRISRGLVESTGPNRASCWRTALPSRPRPSRKPAHRSRRWPP